MKSKSNLPCKRSLEVIWSYSPSQTMPIYVAIAVFGQVAQVPQHPIFLLLLEEESIHYGLYVFFHDSILSPLAFILNS